MAAFNMLRLTRALASITVQGTPSLANQRTYVTKSVLSKLRLPKKPKRPVPPFLLFRAKVKEEMGTQGDVIELSRVAGTKWRDLDQSVKDEMSESFRKEFANYKKELEEYESKLSWEQKNEIQGAVADIKAQKEHRMMKQIKQKRLKQFDKPKAPMAPFLRFLQTRKRNDDENSVEFSKRMGTEWEKLAKHEKDKLITQYEIEKEQYSQRLLQWEHKMIDEGNVDVVRSKTLREKLKTFD